MPDSRKGNWPKVAIGGLVLLNLVLFAALVLRDPSPTLAAVPAAPSEAPTASRSSSATTSPSPEERSETPTPTASPSASTPSPTSTSSSGGAVRSTRVLAVNSDKLAWRGTLGACPTDPGVEVSRDGGHTWRNASTGLESVTRLRGYGESSVFAVGGGDDCEARYVSTGGPTETWGSAEGMLEQTWYRLPDETHRVHAPSGRLSSPCGDRLGDFAGLGDTNAAAICADGTIRLTEDSGKQWRAMEGMADGLAVGADDNGYVVAMRKAGCDGIAVTMLTRGEKKVDSDDVRCAADGRIRGDDVAVGVRGDVIWLWAGKDVAVSTDRGRTWDQPA